MKGFLSWKIILLVLVSFLSMGCKNFWHPEGSKKDGGNKVIAAELRGKWQLQSLNIGGTWYTLPVIISGNTLYNAGYEYSSNGYKQYENGFIVDQNTGIYTEGNRFYLSNGDAAQLSWQISGSLLTLTNTVTGGVFRYDKTSRFLWE